MSFAADSNTATRSANQVTGEAAGKPASHSVPEAAVEQAIAAAAHDASRITELLDVLREARLWLPLPADGRPVVTGGAVTLPTVSYLGSEFVPAYSSPQLLQQFARTDLVAESDPTQSAPAQATALVPSQPPGPVLGAVSGPVPVPHVVVRAADLARLLPPAIGIALNAGAAESVPVYPPGVSYLAAADSEDDPAGMTVQPLPVRPDALLAAVAAGLIGIPAVRGAVAAWLSLQLGGEGLVISVALDDPADPVSKDLVVGAVERAAWQVKPDDTAFPIDVTFPGEREPDRIDERIAAVGTPFYRRA
ncbi:MAG: SseB family protein [Actinobacteria bacterium]|nr:SseB family protein [Actinomycetota bacterium]